ncbi:SCO3242 family prenyltransferase [Streptomyces sp. NPDC005969]|uniref:SCO3242 family prenyltransferase n=1 Tax=Streptomyces sp. NPDC005969 TaxID=3156722 RepID=UPI0033D2B236
MTATVRAWAELLRISALFTVPGDALAGAAAIGRRPGRGTVLAVGASLCLYEAGMALNDWADRDEDAVDRPHRPIPSGRITPGAALTAAGVLTAAGLSLAARAGRPALTVATGLAATVWAYDLHLKHTQAGPAAMATARALDLLLGATATWGAGAKPEHSDTRTVTVPGPTTGLVRAPAPTPGPAGKPRRGPIARLGGRGGRALVKAARDAQPRHGEPSQQAALPLRAALSAAGLLGAHTYAVTAVSRHEAHGGSTVAPLSALAAVIALGATAVREQRGHGDVPPAPGSGAAGDNHRLVPGAPAPPDTRTGTSPRLLVTALTGAYLRTAAEPLLHATLNPSPPLTQRAVGSGIRAMIPLQAALAARAGAAGTGLAVMGLVPLARTLARKVSPT